MRPTLTLCNLTLAIPACDLAIVAGIDSVTIQADNSWTPKGWTPAVRPLTRRNATAALVAAVHASNHEHAMIVWQAMAAGNVQTALAIAMALPIWAKPESVRDTWVHEASPNRPMIVDAMVREASRLAMLASIQAEMDATASLDAMEAEKVAKGKASPFPTPAPGKVTARMLGKVDAGEAGVAPLASLDPTPAPSKGKGRKGKGK